MSRVFRQIVCAGLAAVSLPLLASDSGIQTGLIPLSKPNLPTVTAPDEVTQPQPLPDIPGLEIEVFGFVYDGVTLFDPIEFDQLNLDELLGTATIQDCAMPPIVSRRFIASVVIWPASFCLGRT